MSNGNSRVVTVPGTEGRKKNNNNEIPPKSAANGTLEIGSVDIHSIGFYWIVGLA